MVGTETRITFIEEGMENKKVKILSVSSGFLMPINELSVLKLSGEFSKKKNSFLVFIPGIFWFSKFSTEPGIFLFNKVPTSTTFWKIVVTFL